MEDARDASCKLTRQLVPVLFRIAALKSPGHSPFDMEVFIILLKL